jgi:tetratricopeptide (TPR) repeat protein
VPRPKDLPSDAVGSLGDALKRCGVDDYLLVGNEIPPLIVGLAYIHALAEAFVDKYDGAVVEVKRVLGIARSRDRGINVAEGFYGLGLDSIIAKAIESGKPVGPSDADAALYIASSVIQHVVSAYRIIPILSALEPLRDKAPQRYIELLAFASDMENLNHIMVEYILVELNEILGSYGDVVKGCAWSLVHAIDAYANLLSRYPVYFSDEEVEDVVGRVVDLLNELGRFKSSLSDIAWADALAPALIHGDVRKLMMKTLRINDVNKVVDKANEVLGRLSKLRGEVQELMGDEEFMGYVESKSVKADEEAVKKVIIEASSHLKHALAIYRLYNDELEEAAKLFNKAAEEDREIGAYENYLINSGWVLHVEAIKDPLAGDELVKKFQQLYEETFKEPFKYTATHLSIASHVLGGYLVSLALTGNYETISKLLEEHWWVLDANEQVSVLTRLMLNALLRPRGELSSELEGKLSVNPEELINAFRSDILSEFLPALMVAFGVKTPEDGIKSCEELNDEDCIDFVSAVKGNSAAVKQLRERVINAFNNSLKGLSFDVESLINEFEGLVNGLDGKSLVQLIAPTNSMAGLALMLRALINGDERLAKAHALNGAMEAIYVTDKLLTKLFLEAYETCRDLGSEGCDLKNDEFRRAVARLFFYHV